MTQTSDIGYLVLEFRKCKQASPNVSDQVGCRGNGGAGPTGVLKGLEKKSGVPAPTLAPRVLDLPIHLRASCPFAHYRQPLVDGVPATSSTVDESPHEGHDLSTHTGHNNKTALEQHRNCTWQKSLRNEGMEGVT